MKEKKSIWEIEIEKPKFSSLRENRKVQVAVVGGGMAGILSAYLLQKMGYEVIVLEAKEIGGGVTHNTSAKVTSQHNLIYDSLIKQFGLKKAREYGRTNQKAIEQFEEIIQKEQIECDWKREPAYVYSVNDIAPIKKEVMAAKKIGLPARFTTKTNLPFEISGAVCFEKQASFHPLKFLYAVAKNLTIYEHSTVTKVVEGHRLEVGPYQVEAKHIIIATHFPFINIPGLYFTKMHQERSYVVAAKVSKEESFAEGMYISYDQVGYSFRRYGEYVLVGGSNHRTGEQSDKVHSKAVADGMKRYYKEAEIECCWSTQDCMSVDQIPYIGTYSTVSKDMYVATGFNKWGMTTSMVAAMYLLNMIMGKTQYSNSIYNPARMNIAAAKKQWFENATISIKQLTKQIVYQPENGLEELGVGQGAIVTYQGKRVGAYHSETGIIYLVETKCTHLGCMLEWNSEEKSWDCPCHGSRFDYEGKLITNPAKIHLKCKKKKK